MAVLRSPSDLVVMASAAEFSVYDVRHEYIVGTSAHRETDFGVAYIAFVADAMKPVRKDHRTHSCFFRSIVKHYIAVFGTDGRRNKQCEQGQQNHPFWQVADEKWLVVSNVMFHSIRLGRCCSWCTRHVVAAVALGQGKCHRTVAETAIIPVQNVKHAEFGGASLGFENFFVAITAN